MNCPYLIVIADQTYRSRSKQERWVKNPSYLFKLEHIETLFKTPALFLLATHSLWKSIPP